MNAAVAADAIVAANVTAMDETKKKADENKEVKRTALWIKILVPVLIVAVVAGIYIMKNSQTANTTDYGTSAFDLNATEDFDLEEVLSYGLPVMIDFGADSCIPCKQMAPILEELNEELREKAIVKFVDVWKNADAAQNVPLRVIPTQFFFDKDGNPYVPDTDNSAFLLYADEETNEHIFTAHEGGLEKDEILDVFKELGVE